MTVIFNTEHNTKCYGVAFRNNGCVKVQNFKDTSNDENTILPIKPIETFLGKIQVCDMTAMSGAFDKAVFDENTVLFEISEECDRHNYLCIGGDMVCYFLTSDDIHEYISNMGNSSIPYIGDENKYFLTPHFIFIRRDRIDDNDLLSRNENSVDPFDCHLTNCGKESFKKLQLYKIHSIYIS